MLFHPPRETLEYWRKIGATLATDTDIALLEAHLGGKAPTSYVEFMKTYGSVQFDFEISSRFEYFYNYPGRTEVRSEAISFIKSPKKAMQYYDGLQNDPEVHLPKYLLPFAMDYGQGELLIEFGQTTERIFYWDFDAHDWESGNTRLGFVSDTMYDFINNLMPFED